MVMRHLFTSESVTEGHPDKVADQLSDAILDDILETDPLGRVACETLVTTGLVVVAGEISTDARTDISAVVRRTLVEVGYDGPGVGFDAAACGVVVALDRQSPDIARGVERSLESRATDASADRVALQGAGDQGFMVGYACDETPE